MLSIGSIITGGFRLFREQPVAVMVWGILYGALTVASSILLVGSMQRRMAAGAYSMNDFYLMAIPVYLFMAVFALVMTAAAFRAVVRPDERMAAFLRLGADEARLLVVALVWFAINVVLYIVMVFVGIAIGAAVGGATQSPAMAIPIALLFTLPILGLMIFFHIRLSPAIPLTLLRRQIAIGEAWRVSRGNFWKLFVGYLVIAVLVLIAYLIVVSITLGPYWAALLGGGRSAAAANRYSMSQIGTITPMAVIGWLASAAFGAIFYALWAGSVGTAALELVGVDEQDYADTFA